MTDLSLVRHLNGIVTLQSSVIPKGAYSASVIYGAGEAVSYNGQSYVAIQPTTNHLPTDTTYWMLLAEKGVAGTTIDVDALEEVTPAPTDWVLINDGTGLRKAHASYFQQIFIASSQEESDLIYTTYYREGFPLLIIRTDISDGNYTITGATSAINATFYPANLTISNPGEENLTAETGGFNITLNPAELTVNTNLFNLAAEVGSFTTTFNNATLTVDEGGSSGPVELASTSLYSDASLKYYWKCEADLVSSKLENTGIDVGTTYGAGLFNQGVNFDGASFGLFLTDIAYTAITFSAWVKLTDFSSARQIIQIKSLMLGVGTDGKFDALCWDSNSATGNGHYPSTAQDYPTLDEWVHVALTRSSSDVASGKLYVNGVKVSDLATYSFSSSWYDSQRLGMRNNYDGTLQRYWKGSMDDIAIFNRELSASEIATIAGV